MRIDHDISLLIPEIWCRLTLEERDPGFLIREGHLEPLRDFDHGGRTILASRLGYRITAKFARTFLGRVFDHPSRVSPDEVLRPEVQDMNAFADGVLNTTDAQQRVAQQYFEYGSIADACPPLRALLTILAEGTFEGKDTHHAEVRMMFTRKSLLASNWYRERLLAKQATDITHWQCSLHHLETYLERANDEPPELLTELSRRREQARINLDRASDPAYVRSLVGTLGLDPSLIR